MSGSYGWAVPNYDYLPTQYFLNAAPDWPKSAYSVFGDKAMTHSGPRPLYPGRRAMVLFPDRPSLLLPGTYDPTSGYGMGRRARGYGMRRRARLTADSGPIWGYGHTTDSLHIHPEIGEVHHPDGRVDSDIPVTSPSSPGAAIIRPWCYYSSRAKAKTAYFYHREQARIWTDRWRALKRGGARAGHVARARGQAKDHTNKWRCAKSEIRRYETGSPSHSPTITPVLGQYGAIEGGTGSTFARLTPWLIGAGIMYFGFRDMEKGPAVRDNPALLVPAAVGLGLLGAFTGGKFLFSGDALFGLTVGGAVGAGYGAVKDQGMIKYGVAGSALGWAFAKILEKMTPED